MYSIVMSLQYPRFHWNMASEAEEWHPVILRCLNRLNDSELDVEEAFNLRKQMKAKGLNPGAIALLLLQLEDADPSRGQAHEIDGYC